MPCQIKNPANIDLSSLEPHVQGMYDYFDQKLGFQKPPTMHFDSDPSNQTSVLGKTAYYDPSSLEIHVFTDGRHPKDLLRSIAHELIHHQQNLEGRLDVGGYMGEGYYLKNEAMRELEQEAMLEGNSLLREYEDTIKSEEKNKMSLKEWKNNELNQLLLKKFGILTEAGKNDPYNIPPKPSKDEDPKPIDPKADYNLNEEELEEAKGEKGKYDGPDSKHAAGIDADADGAPDGGDKDKDDPEIQEGDLPMGSPPSRAEREEQEEKERERINRPRPGADKMARRTKDGRYIPPKKEGLQETLKRLTKAKSITVRGKKIK